MIAAYEKTKADQYNKIKERYVEKRPSGQEIKTSSRELSNMLPYDTMMTVYLEI